MELTAMILAVVGGFVVCGPAMANEQTYIPWTFDGFNSNCEVMETAGGQPVELSAPAVVNADDEEIGELGW